MLISAPLGFFVPGFSGTTWNPSDKGANVTLSNGNKTGSLAGGVSGSVRSIKGQSSGKWYAEVKNTSATQEALCIGIANASMGLSSYMIVANGYCVIWDGRAWNGSSLAAYCNASTTNTVMAIACDFSTGKVWFGPAGVWGGGGSPSAGTGQAFTVPTSTTYYLAAGASSSVAESWIINAGSSAFTYSPPSGFSAWGA